MTLSTRPILSKTKVVKVLAETTIGIYIAATQAIYFEDSKMVCTGPFIPRNGDGKYLGHGQPGVIGELSGKFTGSCEMRGNGTTGCEAGLAILLQCCRLVKSTEVYQIHSNHANDKTCTIEMWESGRKKCLTGASGTFKIKGSNGGRIMLDFEFQGSWVAPIDEAIPTWTPSTDKPFMAKGGVFTLATNAIKISEFEFDMGCVLVPRRDIVATSGINYVLAANAEPMFSCDPEAHLISSYDYHGLWLAGTEAAVVLTVQNAITKCTISLPKLQYREVPEEDRDGILIHRLNGQCNQSSGDDSVVLTFAGVA
jgi:hypothetical protein